MKMCQSAFAKVDILMRQDSKNQAQMAAIGGALGEISAEVAAFLAAE